MISVVITTVENKFTVRTHFVLFLSTVTITPDVEWRSPLRAQSSSRATTTMNERCVSTDEIDRAVNSATEALSTFRDDRDDDRDDDIERFETIDFQRVRTFVRRLTDRVVSLTKSPVTRETNLGCFLSDVIDCAIRANLTDVEYCITRKILREQAGDFLREITSDETLARDLYVDRFDSDAIRSLTDACSFFKNPIVAATGNDDDGASALCPDFSEEAIAEKPMRISPLRLIVSSNLGKTNRASIERGRKAFLTPMAPQLVSTMFRRESARGTSEGVANLPVVSRYDWCVKFRYLTDAVTASENSTIKRPDSATDRFEANVSRAKILNAFGRLAVIEPKLFVCKISRY